MKKMMTIAAIITVIFTSLHVNAQRGYERDRRGDDRRDFREYRDNRFDDRRERRDFYNDSRYVYRAPERRSYYYYPQANVYFNPIAHNYCYARNGAWITVNTLPRDIYLDQNYQEVYCNDNEDIWAYNRAHIDCYRPAPRPIYVAQPIRPRVAVGINFGVRF
ncbi:hypothetical protein ACFOW1_03515 [Parasediminibacterium paludis]|uniref:Secreted protein n=1 Tax=Parasediminibacterium paludis TaxID=908966 RepID=A0ABV8PTM6_9BACT